MTFVVGLTGGIGSGKSAVADLFSAFGATIVDTDVIAHELTCPDGGAMSAIRDEFGASVVDVDGRLNRPVMRRLAFADASVKNRLEAILHPLILAESEKRCVSATSPYAILVVPLLVETGFLRRMIRRILLVDCKESLQESRVMSRSGLSLAEVRAIMATQASRPDREAVADDIVLNNGNIETLSRQVAELHRKYFDLAHGESGGRVAEGPRRALF
ncbi:MAG: dephospho-CoA kinase [Candidatus Accumulibacter sp.]|jgi:dephospho-CoA kinase|nr:dephospho-CoA kinase [Accumulibacter sp.]